jgi:hypothetical protein
MARLGRGTILAREHDHREPRRLRAYKELLNRRWPDTEDVVLDAFELSRRGKVTKALPMGIVEYIGRGQCMIKETLRR